MYWTAIRYCVMLHFQIIHSTLPITKKKYAEILLHYRCLFVKDDVFIGKRGIFGAEVFLRYRQFFVKSDFIIGGVECTVHPTCMVHGRQLQY